MNPKRFFAELKRRNVVRMAGLYLVGAWLLTQVASTVFPTFEVPSWALRGLIITLALGFIPALIFSWVFELTPQGLKRDEDVAPEESIAPQTARRMNRMIIGVLVLALGYFCFDKFVLTPRREAALVAATEKSVAARPAAESKSAVSAQSVAVLAFANLSDDKGSEYFSDGISEELLNVLSKVPGLKVSARTSAFHFKGKDTPIPEIAKQLGVAYVVEGSVRKSGEKVRITAQLIKAADGFHVWSDTFTRDLKDIFAVQDEIAGLIAQNLQLKLGAAALPAATSVNPEAYRLYLEGRQLWGLRTKESLAQAQSRFEQAIALDARFARAYVGLSDVHVVRAGGLRDESPQYASGMAAAKKAINLALAIDPQVAEAYASLGNILTSENQPAGAEEAFRRALALNPNYATAHQWYGRSLAQWGRFAEALAELEKATQLDPLSAIMHSNHALILSLVRRWPEALAASERALALQPDSIQGRRVKAEALLGLGRRAEAAELFRALLATGDFDRHMTAAYLAGRLALAGDREKATSLLAAVQANSAKADTDVALALFAMDKFDEAMLYLKKNHLKLRAYDLLDGTVFDGIRSTPRFTQLVEASGEPEVYRQKWAQISSFAKLSGKP